MFYYRVTHKYMLFDHIEKKDTGIYSSLEKAKYMTEKKKEYLQIHYEEFNRRNGISA